MSDLISALRRLLVVFLLAIWWGGFAFYALAVIPSGHRVLHNRVRQGFITQRVTVKLNWLGVATIALALTEVLAARPQRGRFRFLLGAWLVCLASQVALFYLHGRLDALLDPASISVTDPERFDWLHQCYLWPATIGWLASGGILGILVWPSRPPPATTPDPSVIG